MRLPGGRDVSGGCAGWTRGVRGPVLAGLLALGGTAEVLAKDELRSVAAVIGVLAVSSTMLLRRTRPFSAPVLWFGAVAFLSVTGSEPDEMTTPFLTMWILPYTIGNRLPLRARAARPGADVGGLAVAVPDSPTTPVRGDLSSPACSRARSGSPGRGAQPLAPDAELHEVTVRADEERECVAARAIAEERRRIAREMHDVVAHSRLDDGRPGRRGAADPRPRPGPGRGRGRADRAHRAARRSSRCARLLGVLHADGRARPGLRAAADAPGQLDALVERTRGAGVPGRR